VQLSGKRPTVMQLSVGTFRTRCRRFIANLEVFRLVICYHGEMGNLISISGKVFAVTSIVTY
jgi:hypothetical protein